MAYTRVSTDRQTESGAGLDAQRKTISDEVARREWTVTEWVEDAGWSGGSLNRPGIAALLPRLRKGDVLIVARLDRLSRSLVDFAGLMQQATRTGWALVALDLGVDTTTPNGRLVANVMASVAEWERETIGSRIRDAMAAKKREGVRLGHRSVLPAEVLDRIEDWREDGWSLRRIADRLTVEQIPTPMGRAVWHASSVRSALSSRRNDRLAGMVT